MLRSSAILLLVLLTANVTYGAKPCQFVLMKKQPDRSLFPFEHYQVFDGQRRLDFFFATHPSVMEKPGEELLARRDDADSMQSYVRQFIGQSQPLLAAMKGDLNYFTDFIKKNGSTIDWVGHEEAGLGPKGEETDGTSFIRDIGGFGEFLLQTLVDQQRQLTLSRREIEDFRLLVHGSWYSAILDNDQILAKASHKLLEKPKPYYRSLDAVDEYRRARQQTEELCPDPQSESQQCQEVSKALNKKAFTSYTTVKLLMEKRDEGVVENIFSLPGNGIIFRGYDHKDTMIKLFRRRCLPNPFVRWFEDIQSAY